MKYLINYVLISLAFVSMRVVAEEYNHFLSFDAESSLSSDGTNAAIEQATSSDEETLAEQTVDEDKLKAIVGEYMYPVGSTYTQFAGYPEPSQLYGGSWGRIYANDAVFFRTEGPNSKGFGTGIQGDAIRNITGQFGVNLGESDGALHAFSGAFSGASMKWGGAAHTVNWPANYARQANFNASRVVPTSNENRPKNVTIRVWVRTAL
ncbi:TPA: hypothetical protein I7730_01435 [Vibrio vulnificus]|uniref:Phage tail protein n=1 Tax=Vibrio vulnificus TaxID=672 RepID=A0A8H9K5G4_VIBVL|nr:hypothetical protein [Vibrio vulnificus]HAS8538459.1 hypothetical protein [Vibrio vulnificus]